MAEEGDRPDPSNPLDPAGHVRSHGWHYCFPSVSFGEYFVASVLMSTVVEREEGLHFSDENFKLIHRSDSRWEQWVLDDKMWSVGKKVSCLKFVSFCNIFRAYWGQGKGSLL